MANIMFNTYCNRKCPYCFAKREIDHNEIEGDSSQNLIMENLEKVINFYKRSQLTRFVILGGEPTIHPDFITMVGRVLKENSFNSILIFSNGLMPEKVVRYLTSGPDPRIGITLNLNSTKMYTPSHWEQVTNTMAALGNIIAGGINVYQAGQDYSSIMEAIKRYNLKKHVRVGITQPILGTKNTYASEKDLAEIAQDLVDFARECFSIGASYSFDCGVRFCMFTLEQHTRLLRYAVKFNAVCKPIIDIGPDMRVWSCFPLSGKTSAYLDDFESRNGFVRFFNNTYKGYHSIGNLKECANCIYRANELCDGGCIARTISSFEKHSDPGEFSPRLPVTGTYAAKLTQSVHKTYK